MLNVVSGPDETKRQILLYSIVLVAITLLLPIWSAAGVIYISAAAALGAGFLYYAFRLYRSFSTATSADLFRYSLVYLALLFGAIAADGLIAA
jgi:protoheme IX farnesyltransferase